MFRFTIRELLLLTIIAALSVGWWLERNELKSREAELAFMRADPIRVFNGETERLREQLNKQEPLAVYLGTTLRKNIVSQSPWDYAILARQNLQRDADTAGYVIALGRDGRLMLEPKWLGSIPVSRKPSPKNET